MSARFRVGSSLARACQQTGFKGEIGYQTFLYPSENEIRRVFMHLVEKLPKDENSKDDSGISSKIFHIFIKFIFFIEFLGSATTLLRRRISQILKTESQKFWLPTNCRKFHKIFPFETFNSNENIAKLLKQSKLISHKLKLICKNENILEKSAENKMKLISSIFENNIIEIEEHRKVVNEV